MVANKLQSHDMGVGEHLIKVKHQHNGALFSETAKQRGDCDWNIIANEKNQTQNCRLQMKDTGGNG